jgi:Nucleotidyl transferase AbiEii toxin, Type IV TA system
LDRVANLSAKQRSELFDQTAANRGFQPAIAEKDFWVCWSLMKLFDAAELDGKLVFKGGTSLSKAHHLIERFSEDIDLVLNWELLGYGKHGKDPWLAMESNTQLDKFNAAFNDEAASYIEVTLLPIVQSLLSSCPDVRVDIPKEDPHVIAIHYPAAFSLKALRPEVKLEFGPLASWVPSSQFAVRSFAAEEFPKLFDRPECTVTAITAERTFWEKATILHQQAHRATEMLPGYSRHYYDLYQLSRTTIADNALGNLKLLADVVEFKQRFYRSKWAHYELAKPGTFRLLPTSEGDRSLRNDYRMMEPMFFKAPPPWDSILRELELLEKRINQLANNS